MEKDKKIKDEEKQIEICENCKKQNNCNHRALIHQDGCKVNDCDCFIISTDKKKIEEMAKDIPFLTLDREVFVGATEKRKVGWTLSEEDNKVIAEELYNAGYRKIPEGSEVLTNEEAERFRGQTVNIAKVKAQACKETAEKILKWLKDHCAFYGFAFVEAYFKEEFGVEVE